MIIDSIIIVVMLLAVIIGIRQGLLTQISYLIALIATLRIAPDVATDIGSWLSDDNVTAHIIGFGIMLLGAAILVWLIAPLLKKLLFWDVLRRINALLGAIVSLATTTILLSLLCTTINTTNLGDIDREKMGELILTCDNDEELTSEINRVLDRDIAMRDYFEPRYIDYETLDESRLFNKLLWVGENIYPYISTLHGDIADIEEFAKQIIAERVIDNDDTE
ncbi:MAG: CvpA family protein [Alistipes sp.]|nr:CvpA family protein [Alistipes sp.]